MSRWVVSHPVGHGFRVVGEPTPAQWAKARAALDAARRVELLEKGKT